MYKEKVASIRNIIGRGRLVAAINEAIQLPLEELQIEIANLQGELSTLERETRMGILRRDDQTFGRNKIRLALLKILNEFEEIQSSKEVVEGLVKEALNNQNENQNIYGEILNVLQGRVIEGRINDETREKLEKIKQAVNDENRNVLLKAIDNLLCIKILYIGSECERLDIIDIASEFDSIENLIRNPYLKLHKVEAPTPKGIVASWEDIKPEVVFFSCHGDPMGLFLKDKDGECTHTNNTTFVNFFKKRAKYTQCVILSSCESDNLGKALYPWCDSVISIDTQINVDTAARFNQLFFEFLNKNPKFHSSSYKDAYDSAVEIIKMEELPDSHYINYLKSNIIN